MCFEFLVMNFGSVSTAFFYFGGVCTVLFCSCALTDMTLLTFFILIFLIFFLSEIMLTFWSKLFWERFKIT